MAELLKGVPAAKALNERTAAKIEALKANGVQPLLAIVRVGDRGDDIAYENSAVKRCEALGGAVRKVTFPPDVDTATLKSAVEALSADAAVHGILLFRPLPKSIDEAAIIRAIAPGKDIDGMTDGSLAGVFAGRPEGFPPCTAQACIEILDYYGYDLTGKKVTVVGRSLVVGKPAAMLLLGKNATVTVCHTRTRDLPGTVREADVVVAAVGRAGLLTADFFRPGQIVVDVGVNLTEDGKLCGDVAFDDAEPIVDAITPVPGGVGSVTTALLISHMAEAAARMHPEIAL